MSDAPITESALGEGLHDKYLVQRRDDPTGKHDDCWFFVLDPTHDRHARNALSAYAESVHRENPDFASELRAVLIALDGSGGVASRD